MELAKLLVRIRGALALRDPEVATMLKLSDTQQLRIQDVSRQNAASLRGRVRTLLGGQRSLRESLQELKSQSDLRMLSVLTPNQQQRFERLRNDSAA